jgi:hypothetical protein
MKTALVKSPPNLTADRLNYILSVQGYKNIQVNYVAGEIKGDKVFGLFNKVSMHCR